MVTSKQRQGGGRSLAGKSACQLTPLLSTSGYKLQVLRVRSEALACLSLCIGSSVRNSGKNRSGC
jgi:hypothetical protein